MALSMNNDGRVLLSMASTGDAIEEQVVSFLTLPRGWHYGQGHPPSLRAVIDGLTIISALRAYGAASFEAFPALTGEIMISAYGGSSCVDITTAECGKVTYVAECHNLEVDARDEPVDWQDVLDTIRTRGWLNCDSSGSSTPGTIATKRAGLNQWLSPTLMEPAYQWFANAA
jgi:hypothetical protein